MNRWMQAMRLGDFAAAWRISDEILEDRRSSGTACFDWPRHRQFIWDGTALEGQRLLVRCYHGLGDTLQFVRLLATPRLQAAEVTLWAQPALLGVLRSVRGIDRLLPLHDGEPLLDYDVDLELMELPHALRLDTADLPGTLPYIYVAGPAPVRSTHRKVGVCWCAGEWLLQRSIPGDELQPLASLPNTRWFSLQYPPAPCPLPAASVACRDIAELAVRMCLLDLVITADTMVAHLAGALCIPVWLLLHHEPDWRWMSGRDDSPWYPSMRLFRQPRAGDWSSVIEQVRDELSRPTSPKRDIRSTGYKAS